LPLSLFLGIATLGTSSRFNVLSRHRCPLRTRAHARGARPLRARAAWCANVAQRRQVPETCAAPPFETPHKMTPTFGYDDITFNRFKNTKPKNQNPREAVEEMKIQKDFHIVTIAQSLLSLIKIDFCEPE
jgi:hypothetical protein